MTRHYLDILADVIRENWEKPALTDYDVIAHADIRTYTYGEMYVEIRRVQDLLKSYGLSEQSHIAICGENASCWAIAFLAVIPQWVAVNIMHTLPSQDIVRQVLFSDANCIITSKNLYSSIKDTLPTEVRVILFEDLLDSNGTKNNAEVPVRSVCFEKKNADSLSLICFTSGSSQEPKAVMLSDKSLSASVYALGDNYSVPRGNMLSFFPLAHMYGLMGEILNPLCQNCHVYFLQNCFSLASYVEAYHEISPIAMMGVPTIAGLLLKEFPNTIKHIAKNINYFILGGAKANLDLELRLYEQQVPITTVYGQTEAGPVISIVSSKLYKLGSSGRIVPTLEGRIADNGEILVRGENVMLGYYKDPEATAAKIDKDGWLHTGDRGHMDEDGYLYVEGRLEQDMIVLPSGENISPVKVEAIINACDGVEESIVLARDGKLIALVVPNHELPSPPAGSPTEQVSWGVFGEGQGVRLRNDLLAQINPQLPAYSQLFGIEFLSEPLARTEKKTIKRYLYK